MLIGGNTLAGEMPAELGSLANLKYIAMGEHHIVLLYVFLLCMNDCIESLKCLTELLVCIHAGDQDITGTLPSEFGNMASLEYLYIREYE